MLCPFYNDLNGHSIIVSQHNQFKFIRKLLTDLCTCYGSTLIIPCGRLLTTFI
jgi:3-methyladenine DNA glycosylase/8-oxoguanine DNA glycosylase